MPTKPLSPLVLDSVGVFGLNTQANASSLDHRWLIKAENIMLTSEGRLTSRKGIRAISNSVGNHAVKSLHNHKNTNGTYTLISSANNKPLISAMSLSGVLITTVYGSLFIFICKGASTTKSSSILF